MRPCPTSCPLVHVPAWHELTAEQRIAYELGRTAGVEHGFTLGWRAADAHAEEAHRAAVRTVRAATQTEPHEVVELKRQVRDLERQRDQPPAQTVDRLDLLPLLDSLRTENDHLHQRLAELEQQLAHATRRTHSGAAA